ncbi:hypothetical protein BJX63DRAFT_389522 [Aspergillus granulosus]|uniref:Uncharacterized protein n=1 Tax=Aspergillus granulosus TaxID=176169 RepID=A0ABR4HK20_9EURO
MIPRVRVALEEHPVRALMHTLAEMPGLVEANVVHHPSEPVPVLLEEGAVVEVSELDPRLLFDPAVGRQVGLVELVAHGLEVGDVRNRPIEPHIHNILVDITKYLGGIHRIELQFHLHGSKSQLPDIPSLLRVQDYQTQEPPQRRYLVRVAVEGKAAVEQGGQVAIPALVHKPPASKWPGVGVAALANLASHCELEDPAANFWREPGVEWMGGSGCHGGLFLYLAGS